MEPDMMSRIFGCSCDFLHRRDDHDPEDNEIIKEYLAVLSPREKEVFLLIKDKAFSYRDVADMLGIHHGRVNNIMSRVGKKFEKLTNMKKPQGE
jgi:RNA polymerase sigma-70 factor (ECF subfamily)